MELTLKQRKAVANGALPKFNLGLNNLSGDMMEKLKIQNMSTNPGGAFNFAGGLEPKLTTSASGLGSLGSGGMASAVEKDPTKFFGLDGASGVAKSGGAGAFLKNNAGGIMNIASTGIDFFSTLGDVSKNKMTSDQMMGSGGQTSESANGISYQQSKVDSNGIQDQIDATAKAGTMASMGKGAALGGAIGSVIPGLGTVAGGVIGGVVGGIAGLFGSRKAKREAERQKKIAMDRTAASNTQNREMAYTTGLRNEFNRENRTDISQSLFHAALGKEKLEVNPVTGKTFQNTLRYTSHGPAIGPQGGWGTKGEVIADDLGYGYEIPTGPNDTAKIDVDQGDSIYSLHVKNPSTGNSVAHDAKILLRAGNGKMSISDKNWLDMNQQVGKMMMYAGKRKPDTNTGYLGGTLKKYGDGNEGIIPPPLGWSTYFAGRPANVENGIIGGTMKGGGFDALEGLGALVINGQRIIDLPKANRPSNATPDIMPNRFVPQERSSAVSPMTFAQQYYLDLPRANRPNNSVPDAIANAANPETAGAYHEMPGMPTHHNVESRFGVAPDDMPKIGTADKTSAITPEMIFTHDQQLRSAKRPNKSVVGSGTGVTTNTDTDNKKPGFLSKLWGGIKGVGSGLDLGNIAQLANAYSIAAQRDARAEGLRAPKSFVANPYEQDALQQLNKLHSDYYPVWAMNRELEGRGKSSIAQSGGLAAGQKMLGYMGLTNQTQQNNMAALFEHQGRENALRAQAAKASLEAGNQSATRQQQAYQWDEDMLARAHAAQENMLETSAYDRQNGLTQFFKNAWEKNQFDRTMNLYESQQKDDRAKTQAIIENLRNNKQNETPEVKKATIAPQTVATMQKLWNRNPNTVDLGELELPEFAVTPAKKVAKPKVTKRRTVKRGGKK